MQLNLSLKKQINFINAHKNDGIMVVLSSPSGAGKTTLVNLISKKTNFLFQFLIQQEDQDQMKFQW